MTGVLQTEWERVTAVDAQREFSSCVVHPTAVIARGAKLAGGCVIGPYSVIGPNVAIGTNTRIGPHVVIEGNTTFGSECQVFQFASVGAAPQDLKFHGEPSTLTIGDRNTIREFTTLQPGTEGGGMQTTIGSGNLFMANAHVGHDCVIGDSNILANSVALSGHVTVGNFVTIGGLAGIHQFACLGDGSFIGAGSMVSKDIPPFTMAQGDRAVLVGLNKVGMQRRGYSAEDIAAVREVYRRLLAGFGEFKGLTTAVRIEKLREIYPELKAAALFLDFVASSQRGVARVGRSSSDD